MKIIKKYSFRTKFLIPFLFFSLSSGLFAQEGDNINVKTSSFGGSVTVQSKGISTIPNLTLGKPAALFNMKVGRKLTFEPEFRFSLNGDPWAIVFWWRYTPSTGDKLSLVFSANHSFAFKNVDVFTDTATGAKQELIRTTRYLAGAITSNYRFNKYLGVGMYLFYSWGIEKFITRNTYMVSFRPTISNIPITKNIVAGIGPDIYYLKMDDLEGWYFTSRFTISRKNFPLSVSALINKTIESNIPSEYDFLWNVGLTYTFNKSYMEARQVFSNTYCKTRILQY